MPIRTILFDADEVIQYPDPDRAAHLVRLFGFVPEPIAAFTAAVYGAEDTTLTGARDFQQVLPPVLARWDLAGRAAQVCEWLTAITVDHGVLALVARLRQNGYRCVLATNQQSHRARFMARDLDYRSTFDRCFFSCEVGFAKPDPRYFRAVLAALELDPDQALFVDDRPQNVASARSVGIHAECFVNAQDGRAQHSLAELLGRFGVVC